MAKSKEQMVDEMLDREAIRDLPVRYCHYVWSNNLEGVLSLFTEDGVFAMEGGAAAPQVIKGQAALRKFYSVEPERVGARPYIHNVVVDLKSATQATGACYLELRSAAQKMKWLGTGYYNDEYEKVGDQWKFKVRNFKMVHDER
jgi:SnoaL-like domain